MADNNVDAAHVVQDIGSNIGNLNANELNAPGVDANEGGHRVGNVRDRLFHAMVVKVAVSYSSIVSPRWRRLIEFSVLCCVRCFSSFYDLSHMTMRMLQALSMLLVLIYVHYAASRYPATCLTSIKHSWPRKGILRVEVIQNLKEFEQQFYDGLLLQP